MGMGGASKSVVFLPTYSVASKMLKTQSSVGERRYYA